MAGFDFEFTFRSAQAPLVMACLQAGASRAGRLGLTWKRRSMGEHCVRVQVDGHSRRMDLLGYRLERDLPLVSEGVAIAGGPTLRARLGRGVADMYLRGRHVGQEHPMRLVAVEHTTFYYPPYDFMCPDVPTLHARLAVTLEVLVGWVFEEVAADVVLEELHTACELVLEKRFNDRAKTLSFSQLIAAGVSDGGLLGSDGTPELLEELKNRRKRARHRNASEGAKEWVGEHWEDIALVLERLVTQLRLGARPNRSAASSSPAHWS